jgi:hypothetical protein
VIGTVGVGLDGYDTREREMQTTIVGGGGGVVVTVVVRRCRQSLVLKYAVSVSGLALVLLTLMWCRCRRSAAPEMEEMGCFTKYSCGC